VIEGAVLATSGTDGGAFVVLTTPLDIGTMLNAASSLQITSKLPEPEAYRDHQIWSFVVAVFDGCRALGSQPGVASLQDCSVMGVSAKLLYQNALAINIVAAFQADGLAKAALQTLNDAELRLVGSVTQDSAARQEGSLVWVRQIIEFDQIGDVFDAFGRP